MSRIVVLGSANMDLVVRQPRLARPGETLAGTSFATGPGGKGLNQAIAAARAAGSADTVAFLGCVGDDAFGHRLVEALRAAGVDADGIRTVTAPAAAGSTGVAAISVTDDGENAIVVVPGANADDALTDADRRAIKQIVINLLSNAVKFTGQGGHLTVRARSTSGALTLTIEDNGCGIPKTALSKLGRPFE